MNDRGILGIVLEKDGNDYYRDGKKISKTRYYDLLHIQKEQKKLQEKKRKIKENSSKHKQSKNNQNILQENVNKKIADFVAIKEIAKLQLHEYNTDRHCKQGSKIVTENKSDFIKNTMSLVYPNVEKLARIDIRALTR